MRLLKSVTIIIGFLVISGCVSTVRTTKVKTVKTSAEYSNTQQQYSKINRTIDRNKNVVVQTQRINTIECNDTDNWYLDGYRVGKSYRSQRTQMLQHRSNYCGYSLNQLPLHYHHNWERGFQVGVRG